MCVNKVSLSTLLIALIALSPSAFADLAPLPEEVACMDLNEGDACSFTSLNDEELSGTCEGGFCTVAEPPVAGAETPEGGEEPPAGGTDPIPEPEGGEEPPAGGTDPIPEPEGGEEPPPPPLGGEAPEAGAEIPEGGETPEPPEAGETPEAGAETPEEPAAGKGSEDEGCDQGAQRNAPLMILALGLFGLVFRRRAAQA